MLAYGMLSIAMLSLIDAFRKKKKNLFFYTEIFHYCMDLIQRYNRDYTYCHVRVGEDVLLLPVHHDAGMVL